jgi:hypothetical protein
MELQKEKGIEMYGTWGETRCMPRDSTPEEKQFAKQIEEEIKARFYRKVKLHFQMETLEEAQDSYKLVILDTDCQGFKDEKLQFSTKSKPPLSGDISKFWAEEFADSVLKGLLSSLPKPGNTIVVMMTPLVFSVAHDDPSGTYRNHISFQYHISRIGIKKIGSDS